MRSRNPILPLDRYCPDGEPHLVGDAEAVFRYLDPSACELTNISYEGTGNASIEHRIDNEGELTLSIETDRPIEIMAFTLIYG